MKDDIIKILKSWKARDSKINSTQSIMEWVQEMNKKFVVNVKEIPMEPGDFWFYNMENGTIENRKGSFFSIRGIKYYRRDGVYSEQPIIYQREIGFLGIICKEIDGIMYFLMQAKVEPGNVNCVQISPTIQATKSNFQQAHGGKVPNYFSYFENSKKYDIIFDQIQSEQGMRFYKKRNRNIMIRVDEDIEVLPAFKWMTLGQIKELMKIDNLVNMDTRTVLSCIPFSTYYYTDSERKEIEECISDQYLYSSIFKANIQDGLEKVFNFQNNVKMFMDIKAKLVPLNELKTWTIDEQGIQCKEKANFDVRYYDIEISGREVRNWQQPLVKAKGTGTFGLMISKHEGMYKFLVAVRAEIGAFDTIEIGPSIFQEPVHSNNSDYIVEMFNERLKTGEGVLKDSLFSEEGGRFYHEQNRNVIMEVPYIQPEKLPRGYFWLTYSSLNCLIQINNCLNIQLRNLLSVIDFI